MALIFCDDDTCISNSNGTCGRKCISIEKIIGGLEQGKYKAFPSCQNYEGRKHVQAK